MSALEIALKNIARDPTHILAEHEDWGDVPHATWVAYHALSVLKDPSYLKFVTDKLQKYVGSDMKWKSDMDAVAASDIHRDCDTASLSSIVEHLSKLTLRQLEIVGI